MLKNNKKLGFTMAEALLVLVILGVIGAICLQSMQTYNPQQKGFDTKAEKAVSVRGQALTMILVEDSSSDDLTGMFDESGKFSITETKNATRIVKKFKKHLVVNALPVNLNDEYFKGNLINYKKTSLGKLTDLYSNFFFMQDGELLGFKFYGNCTSSETKSIPPNYRETSTINNICASIFVDVNGEKSPNKLGSDQFVIPIDVRGIKYSND